MRKFKKYITVAMSIFMALFLMFHMVSRVFAESGDGFALDEAGNVTLLSEHAAKEGVSSLQFSLVVDAPATAQVTFAFADSNASVCEYSYNAQDKVLNVYMAGRNALFAENADSLSLGRIQVTDPAGTGGPVTVSVAGDSLKYVYGSDLKTMEGVELPGDVLLGSINPEPTQTPRPTDPPKPPEQQDTGNDNTNTNTNTDNAPILPSATPTSAPVATPGSGFAGGTSRPTGTGSPQETAPGSGTEPEEPSQEEQPEEGESTMSPFPEGKEDMPAPGGDIPSSGQKDGGWTKPDEVETIAMVVMAAVGAEFTFTGVMVKKALKPGRKRYRRTTSGYGYAGSPRRNF